MDVGGLLAAWGLPAGAHLAPLVGGHINTTYRVTLPGQPESWLLQRLNPVVFPDGLAVLRNMAAVTAHLARAAAARGEDPARTVLSLLPTAGGGPGHQAGDGAWWRLLRFIPGARAVEHATAPDQAFEAGRAFGRFHALMAGYAGAPLTETLPGFHDTAGRYDALTRAVAAAGDDRRAVTAQEVEFAVSRRHLATQLTAPLAGGVLPGRIAHNDAKIANVLLELDSGRALAVVDLDTVMPGTPLFDVGDLIRSLTGTTPEDHPDPTDVELRPAFFAALAEGFLGAGALGTAERARFVTAGLVITYEQGLRFLTDFLEGDRYYRTTRPGQNLDRARVQFALVRALEAHRPALEQLVR